jgi:hypothetical protein
MANTHAHTHTRTQDLATSHTLLERSMQAIVNDAKQRKKRYCVMTTVKRVASLCEPFTHTLTGCHVKRQPPTPKNLSGAALASKPTKGDGQIVWCCDNRGSRALKTNVMISASAGSPCAMRYCHPPTHAPWPPPTHGTHTRARACHHSPKIHASRAMKRRRTQACDALELP